MIESLKSQFLRDLTRLKVEINAYRSESNLWLVEQDIKNSAGNLCLHLIGNLNAFIGAELGNTGYVRQRDLEFSEKNVARSALIENINATSEMITATLDELTQASLLANYPKEVFGHPMTTEYFLIHLLGHLNYHLGQINYHRRLLDQ